jgi:hypothetical protein
LSSLPVHFALVILEMEVLLFAQAGLDFNLPILSYLSLLE